jgi:hypothetical protein
LALLHDSGQKADDVLSLDASNMNISQIVEIAKIDILQSLA